MAPAGGHGTHSAASKDRPPHRWEDHATVAPVREWSKPAVSKSVEVLQGEPDIRAAFPENTTAPSATPKPSSPARPGWIGRATMLGISPNSDCVAGRCVKMAGVEPGRAEYLEAISDHCRGLAAAADGNLAAPVAGCPDGLSRIWCPT